MHLALEALAVFGEFDRLDRRPQQLDVVALEDAGFVEFDGEVEAGLAAERRQQRVRPLARDDRFDRRDGQRLEIDRVGDLGIGHDRRRIRVDEDDAVAFLAQRPARLNAGVIELCGLTDDDRTRADDHDVAAGHARAVSLARAGAESWNRRYAERSTLVDSAITRSRRGSKTRFIFANPSAAHAARAGICESSSRSTPMWFIVTIWPRRSGL